MPLDFENVDDEDAPRLLRPRFGGFDGQSGRPWWRPASTAGRTFLAVAVLGILGGFTYAGLTLKNYVGRDARFRIAGTEDIQAAGLTEVTRAQMLPVFGEDIGRNIFFVPLDERRRELEQIPWIERATVMRLLPDQIRVAVVERQPVAFARQGNRIGLVDANGVLLNMTPAAMAMHHYSFPVVTGIDPGDPADARKARMTLYLRLMAALDSTGKHFSQQISEIDLTDPEDARVLMPEQGTDILAHFGEERFLERYQRFEAYIGEWRQQYPQLAAVDLRYDRQVVLQMTSGKQAPEPDASDAKPLAGQPEATGGAAAAMESSTNRGASRGASKAKRNKAAEEKHRRGETKRSAFYERRATVPMARGG